MGCERAHNEKERCREEVYFSFPEGKGPRIANQYRVRSKWQPALLSGGCCQATRKGGEFWAEVE